MVLVGSPEVFFVAFIMLLATALVLFGSAVVLMM
jgi:hypothetical protein